VGGVGAVSNLLTNFRKCTLRQKLRYLPSPYLGGSTLCRAVPARPHLSFCRLLQEPSAERYFWGRQLLGRGHVSAITVFRMLNVGSAKRPWSGLSWNLNTSVLNMPVTVRVSNLVSQMEAVWEQSAEQNIWT